MGKGYSAPSAEETAAANKDTAKWNTELSFVDQYTPYGTYIYDQIREGDENNAPRYSLTTYLSPTENAKLAGLDNVELSLLNYGTGILDRAGNSATNPIDPSKAQTVDISLMNKYGPDLAGEFGLTTGNDIDVSALRDEAYRRAYDLQTSGMDSRYDRELGNLENKLTNQGIQRGSEAWDAAMGDFNKSKDSAYADAFNNAYLQSLAEEKELWNQANNGAALNNAAVQNAQTMANNIISAQSQLRNQQLQEQNWLNNYDLNQLNSLLSGTQVTSPSFTSVGTSSAPMQPYTLSNNSGSDSILSSLIGAAGSIGAGLLL